MHFRTALTIALLLLASSCLEARERHTVAVIGTGSMGSALGVGLAKAGHTVVYGSREPSRAPVAALVRRTGHGARAAGQREAAQAGDIVVLAVPWAAVRQVLENLGDLDGKILVDITTAERQGADGYPELAVETSTSELIRGWVPGARVVKTPFSAAAVVEDPLKFGEPTVTWIAADDREAKETVARLAIDLGFFPIDAGPLRMARSIDHLGLLFLTPLMQGREVSVGVTLPRVMADFSCLDTQGWFEPVADAAQLASFPNLDAVKPACPE